MREEHEDGVLAPLVAGEGCGVLSTCVCAGCGYTVWYAAAAHGPVAIGHPCSDCGSIELATAGELREEHGWTPIHIALGHGRLELAVCRVCTRLRFTAQDIPMRDFAWADGVCRWCGAFCVQSRDPVDERVMWGLHRPLPVAYHHGLFGEHRRGRFALRICRGCGDTEWRAEHLDELREDARAGVRLLERKAAVGEQGGPYR